MSEVGPALLDAVKYVVDRRSRLLVPAFAVGRTQTILWYIQRFIQEGKIPAIPIYVDSPMGVEVSEVHTQFKDYYDQETSKAIGEKGLFSASQVTFASSGQQSRDINAHQGAAVIIASSPTCEFGRILHHLKRRLPDPETTLLFVGFQAAGTLGRRILEGAHEVRIHGETVTVRAEIRDVPALSAHADQRGLVEWSGALAAAPRAVYLVHGEPKAREALSAALRSKPGWNVVLPEEGQAVELQ
jgi:metallo-beta-lactamase family protein